MAAAGAPGAFARRGVDELAFARLEGAVALLLARAGPAKREPRLARENGKPALRVKLLKALRGALQATLPLWGSLSGFLAGELGFVANPRDPRAVSKIISGKAR